MNRRLQHHAVLRGADVDPPQLVFRGDLAFDELADLVVGLAQILGDVADHILVDLDDLQFGLGDLALGLRARGDVLRPLAGEPGRVALERRQPRDLHQMLVVELRERRPVPSPPARFPGPSPSPAREAGDFLVQLRDPLVQLRLLSGPPVDADLEQFGLARHDVLDVGIVGAIEQRRRKHDLVEAALLGLQPRGARPQPVEVLGDDRKARLDDGVVEPHHDVAGLDQIAVARADFADHAAGRMLNLLDVGIDHDRSRRDQRARDFRGRCPAAEAAGEHDDHRQPDDQMQPDRAPRALPSRCRS